MHYEEFIISLQKVGKDPSRLVFEDELTGIHNRRFFLHYLENKLSLEDPKTPPVSLLMIDVDNLKQVNDAHGHAGGDLALVLVARLLNEIAGEEGVAARYAGDEFVLLLPDTTKEKALEVGEGILRRCRAEPLRVGKIQDVMQLTLSVGAASVPEDASNATSLVQRADAALYYAKKLGRNRLVNATELALQDIPEKAALQSLQQSNLVGRDLQLDQVLECYTNFRQGHSQFVVIEGAAGMGKTVFLETIRGVLTEGDCKLVTVKGIQQETFRPYYLATNIFLELLNQEPERGAEILERMSEKQRACLSIILPQLRGTQETSAIEQEEAWREALFAELIDVFPKLTDFEPLGILVDDLQLADEATLLLLRRLMLRDDIPLFACGTSLGSVPLVDDGEKTPLERFSRAFGTELNVKTIVLSPLTAPDIRDHVQRLFPRIKAPQDFDQNLTQVTQGNPLFLSEILRKLVSDQKIMLAGQQWIARTVDENYLPRSLEGIVGQKLLQLDEEGRELLAHASTIGEHMPLSMLTGSSDRVEARVEEFVERCVELGLISSEFRHNDEVIRFLGKRILEITYGSIQRDKREQLHEHVGNYQEALYRQRLLPSASYLAYHYKRSANGEKAKRYEDLQAEHSAKIFNAEEAFSYSGDRPDDNLPDHPLDPQSLTLIPALVRHLLTAVRNIKLYPGQSQAVTNANTQLLEVAHRVLSTNPHLKVQQKEEALLVNGEELDATDQKALVDKLRDFLRSVELGTLAFTRGLAVDELGVFLQAFGNIKPAETLKRGFWKRFAFKQKLEHIKLTQVTYVERGPHKEELAQAVTPEGTISAEDLERIQEVIRHLLSAAKNIKLYPAQSKTILSAVGQLAGALRGLMDHHPSLTLGRAEDSLLVNGEKIDTAEFKAVAGGFLEFLTSIGLHSVTFLPAISQDEVAAYIGTLRDIPSSGVSLEFWKERSRDLNLSNILFDEYLYGIQSVESSRQQPSEQDQEELPFDVFLQTAPERASDLMLRGETEHLQAMVDRMFRDFKDRDVKSRQKVAEMCGLVLDSIPMGFIPVWSNLVADPLIVLCGEEKDPKVFVVIPTTLHNMAEKLVPFAEYLLAARIFSQLVKLYQQFQETSDSRAGILAKVLDRKMASKTQKLLVEELKSEDRVRQQAAIQVLGSLGPSSMYLLVDVIKSEEDLRVRQVAAGLLAELGPRAADALKRELVLEVTAQGRFRILEVIDTVTQSLEAELAFALGDKDAQVRKAAFQLAERLEDKGIGPLLLSYASSEDMDVAVGAIRCLGKLKPPPEITDALVSLLNSAKEPERGVACCQALGQIADTNSIEALARVVARRGWFYFGKRWNAQVRGAATFALKQIHPSRVAQVLRPLLKDQDPQVRQVARAFTKG